MPRIYIDPVNFLTVLGALAYLAGAAYFFRVRNKSAATWLIAIFMLIQALTALYQAAWVFSQPALATNAVYNLSVGGTIETIVRALSAAVLAQACYRFREHPFRNESVVIGIVSVVSIVATVLILRPIAAGANWANVGAWSHHALWAAWGAIVLLRKRAMTPNTPETRRSHTGYLALAVVMTVVCIYGLLTVYTTVIGSAGGSSIQFLLTQSIFSFVIALIIPVVYVEFAPEPTTFQVKLVGFVLLVVIAIFGVLGTLRSVVDEQRVVFDPAESAHTLSFLPAEGGEFNVSRGPLLSDDSVGEDLRLTDDARAQIDLPFGFPFAGDMLRAVIVNSNGAIEPSGEPYPINNYSQSYLEVGQRPLIAPWYTDMNPAAAGRVEAAVRPDRLVVTWRGVPEWSYYSPHTFQVVLYATGRIDFNFIDVPFNPYVAAQGILVTPVRTEDLPLAGLGSGDAFGTVDPDISTTLEPFIGGGPVANPFVVFDRRMEFKRFLHRQTMPFVWVVLGALAFVLLCAPLFYRLTLTRPLDRLLDGMSRVNEGDLNAELPVGVKDEFGSLALNFNRMTQSLRRYSGDMEALVSERTEELNQSLESLKSTQEQLVQQEKMASLGQLTAGIAHEIKNPLNFINNFSDLNSELADEAIEALQKGEDPIDLLRTLKENASVIAEHGRRADGIVRSMMEHASHGSSTREPVNVNELLEEYLLLACHSKRAASSGFDVQLVRAYSEDTGSATMVRNDIGRVLLNLIGNAFDAVQERAASEVGNGFAPVISVAARREMVSGGGTDRVLIEISDNGAGIPDALKKKIFDPFFTTKPPGQGTGLGLSMSYDVVASGHGGSLEVSSTAGGGARFVVSLPA